MTVKGGRGLLDSQSIDYRGFRDIELPGCPDNLVFPDSLHIIGVPCCGVGDDELAIDALLTIREVPAGIGDDRNLNDPFTFDMSALDIFKGLDIFYIKGL